MLKKVVIMIAISIVAISSMALPVLANTNYNLTERTQNEDSFWNYDFCDGYQYVGEADHVDQPLTIVFCGQTANTWVYKSRIRNAFYSDGFIYAGSTMYNELDDGAGWDDDGDGGRKTSSVDYNGYHYRLYAANGSYMTNATWNRYVIATTHKDVIPFFRYGYSEDCENYICYLADQKSGWIVYEDYLGFANRDWPGYLDGSQYWQCDGFGSKIILPP